jgi:hypothetical protein
VKVFAALVLFLGVLCPAHADTLTFQDGEIIIPDGSTVISSVTEPGITAGTATPFNLVTFSFADGTGFAGGDFNDGDGGIITFTVPVTSLTISWVATGEAWTISTNGGAPTVECQSFPSIPCNTTETLNFTGVVTSIGWANFAGFSGFESMSYTLEGTASIPEPQTLWLLLIGLLLLSLYAKKPLLQLCHSPIEREALPLWRVRPR